MNEGNEIMSGYLNKATLIGNLGQDPEVRTMQSGGQVVTLSIATSESWKDPGTGERRDRTEWHRVVIFNEGLGKIAEQYLAKGAKVYVEGQIRTRKWQDQSGADRYSTEIHLTPYNGEIKFLDSRKPGERVSGGNDVPREQAMAGAGAGDLSDEIPFAPCWQ
jgi:single-strand DNA-binding protein